MGLLRSGPSGNSNNPDNNITAFKQPNPTNHHNHPIVLYADEALNDPHILNKFKNNIFILSISTFLLAFYHMI